MPTVQDAHGFALVEVGRKLERFDHPPLEPGAKEVVVEVAGCGVCHTDLGFALEGIPTRHPLPLVLGHEISGRVVAAGQNASSWVGKTVIVPAVIPCGDCPACAANRPTICKRQFMPGNDGHGGFATHVQVPALGLCEVPGTLPAGMTLADLSVVADAVTTPYEAIRRSGLGSDDVAVFVGVGGVGGFGVQIAAALGAAVVAVDVSPGRLELAARHGASLTLDASMASTKEMRGAIRSFVKESGKPGIGLKIFETSGVPEGQATAYSLLNHGAFLAVVGYTPKTVEVRLSNLMAFDATACGNWGCPPDQYPGALAMILEGKVSLGDYVEHHPLDEAPSLLEAMASHAVGGRPVLVPGS